MQTIIITQSAILSECIHKHRYPAISFHFWYFGPTPIFWYHTLHVLSEPFVYVFLGRWGRFKDMFELRSFRFQFLNNTYVRSSKVGKRRKNGFRRIQLEFIDRTESCTSIALYVCRNGTLEVEGTLSLLEGLCGRLEAFFINHWNNASYT